MTYVLVWVLPGGAVLARYMLRPVSVCYKSEFTKTAKHRIMQTTPHDSPGTPVSYAKDTLQYIHPVNVPLSGTTRVSWYQKGKTNLDFTEARDSEWQ